MKSKTGHKTEKIAGIDCSNDVMLVVLLTFSMLLLPSTFAQVDTVCSHPLGMQDKRIIDAYLSSSSVHAPGTGARYSRLQRDEGDGAWCPNGLLEPNTDYEYLQITLPYAYVITGVATQGRYAHGNGNEYVTTYQVKYSRDGRRWYKWSNLRGVDRLQGNVDTNTVKQQLLNPSITGVRYIRIVPISNRRISVCLRVELYGCRWNSGLESYKFPTPDDYPVPPDSPTLYSDDSYDGIKKSSYFTSGLGQLSDGVVGNDDIAKTNSRVQAAGIGYDYVGWSRKGQEKLIIAITFQFDSVKNFTSMKVHCNVDNMQGSRPFSSVVIQYSTDGITYAQTVDGETLAYTTGGETTTSRFVTVPLRHLVARFVKASFVVAGKRLLISEVEFDNQDLPGKNVDNYAQDDRYLQDAETFDEEDIDITLPSEESTDIIPTGSNVALIAGILGAVIVILIVVVLTLYYRHRYLRKTVTPPSYSYRAGSGDHVVTLAPLIRPSGPNGNHIPAEVKVAMPIYQEIGPTVYPPDNIYREPKDATVSPPPPYQHPQDNTQAISSSQRSSASHGENGNISHYAETDLFLPKLEEQPLQGVFGNNTYAVPWQQTPSPRTKPRNKKGNKNGTMPGLHGTTSSLASNLSNSLVIDGLRIDPSDLPPEFSREGLTFVEKLGEGQFGEVQLCKADSSLRELLEDEDFHLAGHKDSPVLVAVKILREGASSNTKENFLKEVRIMNRLQDPNIVHLLAICTTDEPFAMITEYMENGDLNQYLRGFEDDAAAGAALGKNAIRNDVIMAMAIQIASGMSYLSSLRFVHRDLATRNCLVGSNNTIRIADFGMSRNMYQSDYYRLHGRAVLPIRWMSWECVLMGKFSSASDVWSFGVTLWEMFSLCKYQPHAALSDQEVIENMQHIFRKTGEEVYLPRPKRCPASIFNMIRQCWKRACEERPNFQQLHGFLLERRTMPTPRPKKPQGKPPVAKSKIAIERA